MNFLLFAITLSTSFLHCQANFLLDMNMELNPIREHVFDNVVPTQFGAQLETLETDSISMDEKEKYNRSFKELMAWT